MKAGRKSLLRLARIVLASISLLLMTVLFASGAGNGVFSFLAKAQFVPALLAGSAIMLIVIALLTFVLGRVYCSVICPLGIMQDLLNWLTKKIGGKKKEIRFGYAKPHNLLRYVVLSVFVVGVLVGSAWIVELLDPYASFGRIMTDIFRPVAVWINNLLASVFVSIDRESLIGVNSLALSVAIVSFVVIAVMSVRCGRAYCNNICPVGTLLGLIGSSPVYRIKVDEEKCNGCGLCGRKCRARCIDTSSHKVDYTRCVDCFDCVDNCNQGAISYAPVKMGKKMNEAKESGEQDESRRKFLSGLAVLCVAGSRTWAREKYAKMDAFVSGKPADEGHLPVSPFGSISHKHLNDTCSACHLCIDKCPQKVLRPALKEYGLGGVMQPVMDYSVSYCDYDCTLCSEVCPAGAIKPLTVDEKQSIHIGLAVYSREDCLISKGTLLCGVCRDACPAAAISLIPDYNEPLNETELETLAQMPADERTRAQYRLYPKIDADLCIGCGACQHSCPTKAIIVDGFSVHRV